MIFIRKNIVGVRKINQFSLVQKNRDDNSSIPKIKITLKNYDFIEKIINS